MMSEEKPAEEYDRPVYDAEPSQAGKPVNIEWFIPICAVLVVSIIIVLTFTFFATRSFHEEHELFVTPLPDVVGTDDPTIVKLQKSGASCNWNTGELIVDKAVSLHDVDRFTTMCDFAKRKMASVMRAEPEDKIDFRDYKVKRVNDRAILMSGDFPVCDITSRDRIAPVKDVHVDMVHAYRRICVKSHHELHRIKG